MLLARLTGRKDELYSWVEERPILAGSQPNAGTFESRPGVEINGVVIDGPPWPLVLLRPQAEGPCFFEAPPRVGGRVS